MKRIFVICLMAGMFGVMNAQNEVVTNKTVIELLQEGFSSEDIIGLIDNSSERQLTFSIQDMRALKQAGATSELIQYIQKVAKVDLGYEGILWWNPSDGGKPKKLHRTAFEQEKKGIRGGALGTLTKIGGIAAGIATRNVDVITTTQTVGAAMDMTNMDFSKIAMPGATARVVLSGANGSNPVFRFYFPKNDASSFEKSADAWYYHMMNEIESPNEFQCIRMKQKKNKRTFPNGVSYGVMGFTSKSGGNRDFVDFEIKDISNNIFEVTFPNGLEPGEYCFFYKNGQNSQWFAEHMFGFDFSVQ